MKIIRWAVIVFSIVSIVSCGTVSETNISANYHSAGISVGYETFYNELRSYGRWIDYPGYGYVWAPGMEAGFRPYASGGHWVYSNYGWTWASDYSWGWAPFHYGRWFYENGYGWLWVPGNEWAPAWVTWGTCGGYYGWAPLAPHVSLSVAVGGGWMPPAHYWNFVPANQVTHVNVNNYIVNNNTTVVNNVNITRNVTIINNNTANNDNRNIQNRAVYNMGPDVREVERQTGNRITPIVVQAANKPGQSLNNNRLAVYRPVVRENTTVNRPMPAQTEPYRPAVRKTVAPEPPREYRPAPVQQPAWKGEGRQDSNNYNNNNYRNKDRDRRKEQ